MFERDSRLLASALVAGVTLLVVSGDLAAQEQEGECQMEGTEATRQAEQMIDEATNLDTVSPDQARSGYERALTRVQLALKQNEQDAAAFWLAGRAHIGLGNLARADSMFNRFIELAPGCTGLTNAARQNAWVEAYNTGIRAYQAGDDTTALERFEAANVIREDARSLNNAALLQQQRGNLERAESLYRRSLEVAEDPEQRRAAAINLAELLRQDGRAEASMSLYADYLERHPEDVTATINYAVALRELASTDSTRTSLADSANALFQRLLEREDLSFTQWFNTGIGLMRSQAFEGAKVAFQKARDLQPYDKPTMQNLVEIHRVTGSAGQAVTLADTLVSWYPYQKDLYRTYIQALDQQGRTQRVQQLVRQFDDMPLEFSQLDMVREGQNSYVVRGQVSPGSRAGQTVTVPFEFLGPDGSVVASEVVTIEVPAQGSANFELVLESQQAVAGFRHGRIQGGS